MSKLLVKHGGGSSHEYLRKRLEAVFSEPQADFEPCQVAVDGLSWMVAGGTLNAPRNSYHGYTAIFRRCDTEEGAWFDTELRNPEGVVVSNAGYSEYGAYLIAPNGELRRAGEAQALAMVAILDQTEFSDAVAAEAAFALLGPSKA